MKINILSPGRFHVCDLARELARNGHNVKFYSFVPTKRAMKFGLPKECSASLFWPMSPFLMLPKKLFRMAVGISIVIGLFGALVLCFVGFLALSQITNQ